jgi:PilZ domain
MSPYFAESKPTSAATAVEEDRRYNTRNRVLTRVQIRRMDAPHIEDVGTTQDLSRDGIYFVVRSQDYKIGMRVLVTLSDTQTQWTCEVVRIEQLPNGGQGVAVTRVA